MAFNPLIQYLANFEDQFGYEMTVKDENQQIVKSQRVITRPFADDFNLLTCHKLRHQKLQDDIQSKTSSMGLTFKPVKCRSLSLCGGKPSKVDFTLLDYSDPNGPERVVIK